MALKRREQHMWGVLIGAIAVGVSGLAMLVAAFAVPAVPKATFLVTAAVMLITAAFMWRLGYAPNFDAEDDQAIRANGIPGTATIMAAQPTGTTIKKQPEISFQLRLRYEGKPDYVVTRATLVPPDLVDRMTAGQTVKIIGDPGDPLKTVFDWDDVREVAPAWGTGGTFAERNSDTPPAGFGAPPS